MNQNGWLIYNKADMEQNSSYIEWFINEAELQGILLELILREELTIGIADNHQTVLHKNRQINLPDFAVVRTIDPMLNRFLESLGINVFNSSEVATIFNDKALTHFHMNQLSIPMTDTVFINGSHPPDTPPLEYPFVMKEPHGRGGRQVYLIHNNDEWDMRLAQNSSPQLIVQSMKNIQTGRDVRVFIIGKEIVGAVLRASDNDFRSNFKLGGSASWYALNDNEVSLISTIVNAFDFGMIGIDFLLDDQGGFLLNEIEDVVGSRTLSAVSDINILEKYVAHIKNTITDRQKSGNP
ncbi:RimK family alpha-L-glutamate ligase [Virgibacillus kekensis]|uniref:RimK family alpha-L-glutamate ligase n=1 Tax=Virgibacillus kekensis TaxID=202261 RepID=A0ABV9DJC7_9BACI